MRSFRYTKGLHDLGNGLHAWLLPDGSWGWSNAGLIEDAGQTLHPRLPSRWALVHGRVVLRHGKGIGRAVRVAATGALSLGQCIVQTKKKRLGLRRCWGAHASRLRQISWSPPIGF